MSTGPRAPDPCSRIPSYVIVCAAMMKPFQRLNEYSAKITRADVGKPESRGDIWFFSFFVNHSCRVILVMSASCRELFGKLRIHTIPVLSASIGGGQVHGLRMGLGFRVKVLGLGFRV